MYELSLQRYFYPLSIGLGGCIYEMILSPKISFVWSCLVRSGPVQFSLGRSGTVWSGSVWCGLVRYGLLWSGLVSSGLVLFGLVGSSPIRFGSVLSGSVLSGSL